MTAQYNNNNGGAIPPQTTGSTAYSPTYDRPAPQYNATETGINNSQTPAINNNQTQYNEKSAAMGAPPSAHDASYPVNHNQEQQYPNNTTTTPNNQYNTNTQPPPHNDLNGGASHGHFYQEQNQMFAPQPQYNPDANQTSQNTTPLSSLQQRPELVHCPVCQAREHTRMEFVTGGTTHATALVLCFIAFLGCIPYFVSGLKDVEHYCGRCGALLAVWHRSGRTEVFGGKGGVGQKPKPGVQQHGGKLMNGGVQNSQGDHNGRAEVEGDASTLVGQQGVGNEKIHGDGGEKKRKWWGGKK